MKVSLLDLRRNREVRMLRVDQDDDIGALENRQSREAVLVMDGSIKFNPTPVKLNTWDELLHLPPQTYAGHKPVSSMAWLTGDNPFLMLRFGGSMLPLPDRPGEYLSYQDIEQRYTEAEQSAWKSRAVAPTRDKQGWAISTAVQLVLAFVCAMAAVVMAVALLPRIMERF